MPNISNMTPSPKQRNRFISTIRRTLRTNPQPASPTTPPFGKQKTPFATSIEPRASHASSSPSSSGSSDVSTPSPSNSSSQPTPQQRRYAAVFSKITFSTAEFIEDRYIYSQSPEKPDDPLSLAAEELVPCPSFFAIPATRQPSMIDQPEVRLDQTSNPTEHRISFAGLSDLSTPTSPLRSCFQEVFDLIEAGLADNPFDLIGAEISDEPFNLLGVGRLTEPLDFPRATIRHRSIEADTPVIRLDIPAVGTSPESLELQESFDLPGIGASEESFDLPGLGMPEESDSLGLDTSEDSFDLSGVATPDESFDHQEASMPIEQGGVTEHKAETVPSVDNSIQSFLYSLSASLRSDPTEFSPRISEWDQESNGFSWLNLDDEHDLDQPESLSELGNSKGRHTDYLSRPTFLKRSPARVKKLSPKQKN
ncbi:hypothetical protein PGTUg99_034597 [Puccinia graminis f. sp. tritici]|uniref:Uncharacterized protein n=1 Tax=Puccinia graminis f. sp. tritici TaxID=56615 RepID=A0A5B0Q978_PUCGR|nr:hypothetical protein PGTUg99_034597 [Puccinia graminis f. sp. tritici]